jgi:hypothetical protein
MLPVNQFTENYLFLYTIFFFRFTVAQQVPVIFGHTVLCQIK